MEFNLPVTAALLVGVVALGTVALVAMGVMATSTVLMMVAPSMLVFGLIALAIGVKHGEYRATH
jgi:hypothetical protein